MANPSQIASHGPVIASPAAAIRSDQACQTHDIEFRLIKHGRRQTNGMVEWFNGRISDVLATRLCEPGEDLEQSQKCYTWLYRHDIPRKALRHQSPIVVIKEW